MFNLIIGPLGSIYMFEPDITVRDEGHGWLFQSTGKTTKDDSIEI